MDLLHALILGAVEGFTEFLPISSTGHLILASDLLGLPQDALLKSFEIAIQLGAIAAVVARYWRRFLDTTLLKKLVVAFIPTGIIGFTVYPFFKEYLNGNMQVVAWALFLGGFALIAFDFLARKDRQGSIAELSYTQCLLIGLCQSVAIIPGVSRSAATIIGGELLGMSRAAIVEFSFLLAVPTMLAATGYDFLKQYHSFSASDAGIIGVGFIAAFAVALVALSFLISLVKRAGFAPFGVYRILIAILFWTLIA